MSWLDHDNGVSVLWSVSYCVSLVLVAGSFDRLGLEPTITVPVVVVVLPFLVGAVVSIFDRLHSEKRHG
jgi:hypothetical protein